MAITCKNVSAVHWLWKYMHCVAVVSSCWFRIYTDILTAERVVSRRDQRGLCQPKLTARSVSWRGVTVVKSSMVCLKCWADTSYITAVLCLPNVNQYAIPLLSFLYFLNEMYYICIWHAWIPLLFIRENCAKYRNRRLWSFVLLQHSPAENSEGHPVRMLQITESYANFTMKWLWLFVILLCSSQIVTTITVAVLL